VTVTLIPNQPYPDLPAWEDLAASLTNGWTVNLAGLFLRGFTEANTVTLVGRVTVGDARIAGVLPTHLMPNGSQGLTALVMKGPSCIVEIWAGGQIVMSNFSLGLTESQMITQYRGEQLFFSGTYPRKTPA